MIEFLKILIDTVRKYPDRPAVVDRIDFAILDSGCKVVLDMEKWNEAMKLEECHEIADPDPHDLAFLLYTSGSTGVPKGVLQEYGIYDKLTKSSILFFTPYNNPEPYIHAEVTPQSFMTGIIQTLGVLDCRGTLHEITNEMARDVDALAEYFEKNNLVYGGFPTHLLKIITNNPKFKFKAAFMGGDSSSNLFNENYDVLTIYTFSEIGYGAFFFRIDKPYEITPAGYNMAAVKRILQLDSCYVNVFIKNGVKLLVAYYMSVIILLSRSLICRLGLVHMSSP